MPVLAEAISVIVKDNSIKEKFLGGVDGFLSTIPNGTYCTDNELHRIGFMDPLDVQMYVELMQRSGLAFIRNNKFQDLAVVDMLRGCTKECDWLGFARDKLFFNQEQYRHSEDNFSIVWLIHKEGPREIPTDNNNECNIIVPAGWTPDEAIYGSNFVPSEKIKEELIELECVNNVRRFMFVETGKVVYLGSPKIKR